MIALYARVSTEEQARSGYSLQDQLRQCRQKAESTETIDYIDDGYSGEFLERPALTKLRHDIREGLIKKVIVYSPDRLSRNAMNAMIIVNEFKRKIELEFVSVTYDNTPQGQFFFTLQAGIAEYEKALINERMSRGRREKAKQGKVVKDVKVYGYLYNKEENELQVNTDEAKVVQLIFDLFTDPRGRVRGINGIANYLMDKGIPTKKGKGIWHRQVVRQILMNETYTGIFYHNKWNTEGILANKFKDEKVSVKHRPREEWIGVGVPAIIGKETFTHAQKLLKESRRRWAGSSKNVYLLSGLVRCGDCGNTMTGRRSKNWGTYIFEYSDVKSTAGSKHCGCGNRIKCKDLDTFVWEAFVNLMLTKGQVLSEVAATNEVEESISFEEFELERIMSELEKIKTGRKRILNFMTLNADVVDEEDIRNQLKVLKDKEEKLLKSKEETSTLLEDMKNEDFDEEILKEAVEQYLCESSPETLTIEQKQEYLRKVFREVRIYDDGKVELIRM
ncbi:recombinase family protein [Priestia megaterium]|uniref:recombinase family protein n=1 Tax=Priestia megaterium TaxID=1404 RepID=UPI001FB52EED|nr:recombinase family protein [Priestia megaterium]